MNFQKVDFLISAASPKDFPKDRLPEIAFAGKSNVGKSSVINRLLQRRNFARVGEKIYRLCNGKGHSYTCEHYIHKTVLTEEFDEFISKITVFVPNEGKREMWNVEITNKTLLL